MDIMGAYPAISHVCWRLLEATALPYEPLGFPSAAPLRNRSVLVWGFGNAAHETARELQKFTQAAVELPW